MNPDDRYGGPNVPMKIMGAVMALAMIAFGGLWAIAGEGAAQSLGPIVAGLGVALGYVALFQKRH